VFLGRNLEHWSIMFILAGIAHGNRVLESVISWVDVTEGVSKMAASKTDGHERAKEEEERILPSSI
tara:strand:- start:372 stop:569 length:198 start_codon:yes stop_codon:yes gene_type:complete